MKTTNAETRRMRKQRSVGALLMQLTSRTGPRAGRPSSPPARGDVVIRLDGVAVHQRCRERPHPPDLTKRPHQPQLRDGGFAAGPRAGGEHPAGGAERQGRGNDHPPRPASGGGSERLFSPPLPPGVAARRSRVVGRGRGWGATLAQRQSRGTEKRALQILRSVIVPGVLNARFLL